MSDAPLFSGIQSSDDLIQHTKRMLDTKANDFHVSFGMWKPRNGSVKHESMIVLTTKSGKSVQKKFEAETMRKMFEQVDEFIKTINQ